MDFNFVKEWVAQGEEEKNPIFQFFCYYIAFNWLYSSHTGNNEHQKIHSYVSRIRNDFGHYCPFALLSSDEWSHDVRDSRTNRIKPYVRKENDPTIRLFLNIYQVRCNLFHGSKSMRESRNMILVKEGSKVLYDFLLRVMKAQNVGDTFADN